MTRKAAEPPRKVRWTVPGVDISVIEWLDTQEDVSQSLRVLIRESIQRDGYIDVAFKPVEQLPRRGRPPGDESQSRPQDDESPQSQQNQSAEEGPVQPQLDAETEETAESEEVAAVSNNAVPVQAEKETPAEQASTAEKTSKKGVSPALNDFLT